jgi:hypothetical protein
VFGDEMKPRAYLTNARIVPQGRYPYEYDILFGNCWGHSTVIDSHRVLTSRILRRDINVFETENTIYTVRSWGEPKNPQEARDENYVTPNNPA